ncbi:MAG: nucleoside triphosphate pyrophosphohydrolase [Gemmatimonadota bacterium]|nr:nucleoside triphosphate pyrophosphohydrolase [Gemmatimonadota bacterium]
MTEDPTNGAETRPAHAARERDGDRAIARALALVRFLRERCPWDARQDPLSLRPYLLEEAHEVADAVLSGDDEALPGELGDLLLNVAFQIVLGEERGAFDASAVVEALEAKMEARHPHVYGEAEAPPDWEGLKAAERASEAGSSEAEADPFDGISRGLDPLSRAARVQERMAAIGFDWPDLAGPLAKVREEADEVRSVAGPGAVRRIGEADAAVEEEIGDLLFAAVNVSRLAGAHPANALLGAVAKFEERCRAMIALAESRGIDWRRAGLDRLDALWNEVKRRG